jgi:hypothetical protein
MGKVFGILFMVLAIWVGIEIYTKGSQEAFGGALAWLGGETPTEQTDGRSPMQRFGDRVRTDMQTGAARTSGSGNPEAGLDDGDVMNGDVDDVEE